MQQIPCWRPMTCRSSSARLQGNGGQLLESSWPSHVVYASSQHHISRICTNSWFFYSTFFFTFSCRCVFTTFGHWTQWGGCSDSNIGLQSKDSDLGITSLLESRINFLKVCISLSLLVSILVAEIGKFARYKTSGQVWIHRPSKRHKTPCFS